MSLFRFISFVVIVSASFISCSALNNPNLKFIKSVESNSDGKILKEYFVVKSKELVLADIKNFDSIAIWDGVNKANQYKLYTKTYLHSKRNLLRDSVILTKNDTLEILSKRKIILNYIFIDGIFRCRVNYITGDTIHNRIEKVEIINRTF